MLMIKKNSIFMYWIYIFLGTDYLVDLSGTKKAHLNINAMPSDFPRDNPVHTF
jgi:hypothetical protein